MNYQGQKKVDDECLLCISVAIIGGRTAESSSDLYLCLMVLTALLQNSPPPVLTVQHIHDGIYIKIVTKPVAM